MSCRVVVDVSDGDVVVIVFGSVQLCVWVDEGVHFYAYSECVEVGECEDSEFVHEGFCMGSGGGGV